jgi:hypothetical protein
MLAPRLSSNKFSKGLTDAKGQGGDAVSRHAIAGKNCSPKRYNRQQAVRQVRKSARVLFKYGDGPDRQRRLASEKA